jgi:hypothetical protein
MSDGTWYIGQDPYGWGGNDWNISKGSSITDLSSPHEFACAIYLPINITGATKLTLCGNYHDSSAVGSRSASVDIGLWRGSCSDIGTGSSAVTLTSIGQSNTVLTGTGTACFTLAATTGVDLEQCEDFIVVGFKGNGGSFGTAQVTWILKIG